MRNRKGGKSKKAKKQIVSACVCGILIIASIVAMIVRNEIDIKLLILTILLLFFEIGNWLVCDDGND